MKSSKTSDLGSGHIVVLVIQKISVFFNKSHIAQNELEPSQLECFKVFEIADCDQKSNLSEYERLLRIKSSKAPGSGLTQITARQYVAELISKNILEVSAMPTSCQALMSPWE
ncbi:unnamed protein product [Caenorhabditis brenneri]